MLRHLLFSLFALCGTLLPTSWVAAESVSSTIYSDVEPSVFQIQVLNKQTGEKSAIGSGFIIEQDNLIATNYHVVSTYVNNPKAYELGFLSTKQQTGKLQLLAVDVIHDLAVLKASQPLANPMIIGEMPPKGAHIYSLGNPLDKGFSIVEGTNNGIMTASDDNNILFSGSLNPGMSGGPALNEQQQVIGINVATSGNGISFLVPSEHLKALLERLKTRNFTADDNIHDHIGKQLLANAEKYIQRVQTTPWDALRIGNFSAVPGNIKGVTRCWDNSDKQPPNDPTKVYYTRCDNENSIYLDEKLEVGRLAYEYIWLEGQDVIPPRFYRRYEDLNSSSPDSDAGEQDISNFACYTNFTAVAGQDFKMTVCRRDYINYPGLSDLLISGALVGHKQKGMLFNLDMTGVKFESGMKLFKQMLEKFQWQP